MRDLASRLVPVVVTLPAASSALAGAIVRLVTDSKPYWCDGTTWSALAIPVGVDTSTATARLTGDVSNATTTLANVSGLALAIEANSTYHATALVMFQTGAGTTGIRLTQTVPTGATVVAQWSTPTSLTAMTFANQRAADAGAATAGIDSANANTLATAELLIVTAANAGTLQIRFASETTTAVTVKAGSLLKATKIP
jgi:hypothetical protein